jgi:hypothetical protein
MDDKIFKYVQNNVGAIMSDGGFVSIKYNTNINDEILEIHNEKPENWIFEEIVLYAENPEMLEKEKEAMVQAEKAKPENALFVDQASLEQGGMPAEQGGKPPVQGNPVAPSSLSNPLKQVMGSMKSTNTKANQSL